jgi:hypothetical protein
MPSPDNVLSTKDKTRIKRLRLKLRHLVEELEQAEELAKEYESDFQSTVSSLQVALGLKEPDSSEQEKKETVQTANDPGIPKSATPPPPAPSAETSEHDDELLRREVENHSASAPSWMKKLYKQIAMKTHPDKIAHLDLSPYEKAEYKRLFDTAKSAIRESRGGDLVYAAEALGIEPDISPSMRISLLIARGERMKSKITQIYKRPSWVWGESDGNLAIRKKMLTSFCQVYSLALPSADFLDKFLEGLSD